METAEALKRGDFGAWDDDWLVDQFYHAASAVRSLLALRERVEGELESLRASRDHAPSIGAALEGEVAWLLESSTPWPGGAVHWFGLLDKPYRAPRSGKREWYTYTADPNAALRFRSKEEAEHYRDHRGLPIGHRCDLIATEHEWPATSSAEQVEVPKTRDELLSKISQLEAELKRRDEALWRSAEGWANAIELRLLPPQHIRSAEILRDEARAALQPQEGGK